VLEILGTRKRIEACGAIEGGRVVRGVVLEILRLASEDPVLRELNSFSGFMELVLSLDKGELRARFDVSGADPAAWVNGYPEVYSGRKPWDTEYVNGFGVPFPMRVGSMSSFLVSFDICVLRLDPSVNFNIAADAWIVRNSVMRKPGTPPSQGDLEVMV